MQALRTLQSFISHGSRWSDHSPSSINSFLCINVSWCPVSDCWGCWHSNKWTTCPTARQLHCARHRIAAVSQTSSLILYQNSCWHPGSPSQLQTASWPQHMRGHYSTCPEEPKSDAHLRAAQARETLYNLPNCISLARMMSSPLLGYWIVTEQWHLCLPGLVVAGVFPQGHTTAPSAMASFKKEHNVARWRSLACTVRSAKCNVPRTLCRPDDTGFRIQTPDTTCLVSKLSCY
jgi:hypothetical protein